jgi:hypothetical protein
MKMHQIAAKHRSEITIRAVSFVIWFGNLICVTVRHLVTPDGSGM